MDQHLFIVLFFTVAVPHVLSVTHQYYLILDIKNWTDARVYCQENYTDLAVIKNDYDMAQLQIEAQKKKFTSTAWIGMYSNISSWHWSMGYEPVGPMRKWSNGEPNNMGGSENCGMINYSGWSDRDCSITRQFVCFDDTKSGLDRYIYIYNNTDWPDAQAYCREHHTDLASSRDENENLSIRKVISGNKAWFGFYKDPWKWVDQSNFSTVSWMSGSPDNYWGEENCGYINMKMGQADDALCSKVLPFFCYTGSGNRKQQIIRLKIKYSQRLNDSAILDKIMQKMKDNEMNEDIVVKWRETSDGEVFQKEKPKP